LEEYRLGRSILGKPTAQGEYRIYAIDRDISDYTRTAKRLQLSPEALDRVFYPGRVKATEREKYPHIRKLREYFANLQSTDRVPDVLFIEGLDMAVPGMKINDPGVVEDFIAQMKVFARYWEVAIVGSVGTPEV